MVESPQSGGCRRVLTCVADRSLGRSADVWRSPRRSRRSPPRYAMRPSSGSVATAL